MAKPFRAFDDKVIEKEFEAVPANDRSKLMAVMLDHELENPGPILIQDYGGGVLCIRHQNGRYQGRCLFSEAETELMIPTVYKKEAQEVPQRVLDRARARLKSIGRNGE